MIVERGPGIALGKRIFQKSAQPIEEILFIPIIAENILSVDPSCDHMVQCARSIDS